MARCTHYGPLQWFSTYFRKLKETGVLRSIFPDYVISCDYVQDKFLDLVNLVLTTPGTILTPSFNSKLIELQWEDQHLQPHQKFLYMLNKLQYRRNYIFQKFGNDFLMFIPFLNVRTWKTICIISKIFIKSVLWGKKVMEI